MCIYRPTAQYSMYDCIHAHSGHEAKSSLSMKWSMEAVRVTICVTALFKRD